jgi:hypothetical protein
MGVEPRERRYCEIETLWYPLCHCRMVDSVVGSDECVNMREGFVQLFQRFTSSKNVIRMRGRLNLVFVPTRED